MIRRRDFGLSCGSRENSMCKGLEVGNACVAHRIERMPVWPEMKLRRVDQAQKMHSFQLCFSNSVARCLYD